MSAAPPQSLAPTTLGPPTFFHAPQSVVVFGASDNRDKVGGRPIHYLMSMGYAGQIFPINPAREVVQGLTAYPDIAALPEVPEVAVIAVGGARAVDAVAQAAAAGTKGCVILASGFAEAHDAQGIAWQEEMVATARAAGMRLVGPNSQGLANFGTGAVLSFSTMFTECLPEDGAVAIVSQSGGMCAVPYGLLRERGVGVRYVHGTGNDSDVTTAEMISAVLEDPAVRIVLTYVEGVADVAAFERAARRALERNIPIVALVGGRSADGARAAASHTGSLASDRVVVDAFMARLGIRRVESMTELVESAEVYLQGGEVTGTELAIITNGGGVCVISSDHAGTYGLPLATFSMETEAAITAALPPFASATNPVDITGALLSDSSLVRKVLDCVKVGVDGDVFMISIPVSGRGYDIDEFALAAADFVARVKAPLVVVTPQPRVAALYRAHGLPVYEDEAHAIRALAGYVHHDRQRRAAVRMSPLDLRPPAVQGSVLLNEADSLALLAPVGEVVDHVLTSDAASAAAAYGRFAGRRVVLKGCTTSVSHKSDFGLVELGLSSAEDVQSAAERITVAMEKHGFVADGLLVEAMEAGAFEVMVGAHRDATYGAVVIVGAGGKYIEAVPDFATLLPPFDREDVATAIRGLRLAPLLEGVRGEAPINLDAWIDLAVSVGDLMVAEDSVIESLDANPVLLVRDAAGTRAVIADAVVMQQSTAVDPW
jgi:acyl-CoA synthetase (NDP forming)